MFCHYPSCSSPPFNFGAHQPNLQPSAPAFLCPRAPLWPLGPALVVPVTCHGDFPGGASGKEPSCQCRRHKRCGFDPWVRKIPWRREWLPTPVFLPGEFHGQRSLVGYSPWGHKELDRIAVTCMHTWCATSAWEFIISPHFSSSCQTMTDRSWWRG